MKILKKGNMFSVVSKTLFGELNELAVFNTRNEAKEYIHSIFGYGYQG